MREFLIDTCLKAALPIDRFFYDVNTDRMLLEFAGNPKITGSVPSTGPLFTRVMDAWIKQFS